MEKDNKKEKTADIILGMLCKQLNKKPETVKSEMRIKEDLGADSLDVVELLMAIEDQYGVQVPDDVVMSVKTVADLIAAIDKLSKPAK
ncbi:MAG: acyl carrier protein [Firmicutes bacterium]|nr:acyl carrier protein [Bacillota bacterium]